jgi:hypothetical protein
LHQKQKHGAEQSVDTPLTPALNAARPLSPRQGSEKATLARKKSDGRDNEDEENVDDGDDDDNVAARLTGRRRKSGEMSSNADDENGGESKPKLRRRGRFGE